MCRNRTDKKLTVLPPEQIKAIIQYTLNNDVNAGHQGSKDMFSKMTSLYHLHGHHQDIISLCKKCDACQRTKPLPDKKKN